MPGNRFLFLGHDTISRPKWVRFALVENGERTPDLRGIQQMLARRAPLKRHTELLRKWSKHDELAP